MNKLSNMTPLQLFDLRKRLRMQFADLVRVGRRGEASEINYQIERIDAILY